MQKSLLLILIVLVSITGRAQKKDNPEPQIEFTIDSTVVLTMDKTIKTLYSSISGKKGAKRNWKQR